MSKQKHPKQYVRQSSELYTEAERRVLTEEFQEKNEVLSKNCVLVDPVAFYRDVFPEGSMERYRDVQHGEEPEVGDERHSNGIITILEDVVKPGWRHNLIIFDDLQAIRDVQGQGFAITAPVSFSGRKRRAENAYLIHGICIDLDDVGISEVNNLLHMMTNDVLVPATYIINSGTGLHIYYLFDEPIPAYKELHQPFAALKEALIDEIWNAYTSRSKVKQYQGPFQGYRIPGTQTKFGGDARVTAFRFGSKVSLRQLNNVVDPKARVDFDDIKHVSLAEARELWPEWYERRRIGTAHPLPVGAYKLTEEQKKRKKAMYDSWKAQIVKSAKQGNRYFHICVLFNYAMKAEIPLEEAEADALQLLPYLNSLTADPGEDFLESDIFSAERYYDRKYIKLGLEGIKRMTGVELQRKKNNGRSRWEHLQADTWVNPNTGRPEVNTCKTNRELVLKDMAAKGEITGRPTKEHEIRMYLQEHPDARKCDVIRDLGLSKNTVYKWWPVIKAEKKADLDLAKYEKTESDATSAKKKQKERLMKYAAVMHEMQSTIDGKDELN